MLLSLAGLSAVPQHLYEAAAIDRAGSWYTFFHITLPLVSPLLLIALIFRTMEAFKTFDIAYILSHAADHRTGLDQALQVRLPGMADRQVLRAGLHRPDHGAGDHQHLREISQQGEGALVMAVVTSSRKKALNRVAIAAILVITLFFLSPLYWIGSTAFKPRSLATTVPPTVFFQPEITPFIKLFTKRVQLTKPVDPAVYDAAPWYEQRIYDGGERILRVGPNIQMSQYPNRFMNSLIVAIISTFIAVSMGTITAYGFSRFKMAGEADWLFFILSTRMLPPIVVAIPMYLMYRSSASTTATSVSSFSTPRSTCPSRSG